MSYSTRVVPNKPIVLKLGKVPNLRSATKRKSIEYSPICSLKKILKCMRLLFKKLSQQQFFEIMSNIKPCLLRTKMNF